MFFDVFCKFSFKKMWYPCKFFLQTVAQKDTGK